MKKGILIFMIVFFSINNISRNYIYSSWKLFFFDFALSANSSKAMVLDNNQGNDEKRKYRGNRTK